MKMRNGFVSNSSSSSFVLIGFEVSKDEMSMKKYIEAMFEEDIDDIDESEAREIYWNNYDHIQYLDNTEEGAISNERHIIGVYVSEKSDDDYITTSADGIDIQTTLDKIKDTMIKLGVEKDIKIYHGSRMS